MNLFKKSKSRITPYKNVSFLKPINCTVIDDDFSDLNTDIKFSVVISVRNEIETVKSFVESLNTQTLLPNEVIVIDHESNDGTLESLERVSKETPFRMIVVSSKLSSQYKKTGRSTIAGNRNFGVSLAKNEIILFTDFGNELPANYFKSLICPLIDEKIDLVGGIYHTQNEHLDHILTFDWNNVDWNTFLPAGRGQAIRKSLYQKCCGQPEWLTYAGEDAYYDLQYRRYSKAWVFNKCADIKWMAPSTENEIYKKFYAYGVGDGENGLGGSINYIALSRFLRGESNDLKGLDKIKFMGYLEGRLKQSEIDEYRGIKGEIVFVFDEHPANCESSKRLISDVFEEKKRVTCFIAKELECKCPKTFDFDLSLFEMYYASDFNKADFLQRKSKKIMNDEVEVRLDSNNCSQKCLSLAKEINDLLRSFKYVKF